MSQKILCTTCKYIKSCSARKSKGIEAITCWSFEERKTTITLTKNEKIVERLKEFKKLNPDSIPDKYINTIEAYGFRDPRRCRVGWRRVICEPLPENFIQEFAKEIIEAFLKTSLETKNSGKTLGRKLYQGFQKQSRLE